jgi:hypothetical protein
MKMSPKIEPSHPAFNRGMSGASAGATTFSRRGEVISWIEQLGIDRKQFEKLVHAGAIERIGWCPVTAGTIYARLWSCT